MTASWKPNLLGSPCSSLPKNIPAVQVSTSMCLFPHQNISFGSHRRFTIKKIKNICHEWKSIFELNFRLKWFIKQKLYYPNVLISSLRAINVSFSPIFICTLFFLQRQWTEYLGRGGVQFFFFLSILSCLNVKSSGMLVSKMWNIDAFGLLCWRSFEKLEWKMKQETNLGEKQ